MVKVGWLLAVVENLCSYHWRNEVVRAVAMPDEPERGRRVGKLHRGWIVTVLQEGSDGEEEFGECECIEAAEYEDES